MEEPDDGGHAATRGFAVVALALAGLAASRRTPGARQARTTALLDAQWSVLRKFDTQPGPRRHHHRRHRSTPRSRRSRSRPGSWHALPGTRPRAHRLGEAARDRARPACFPRRSLRRPCAPGLDRAFMVGPGRGAPERPVRRRLTHRRAHPRRRGRSTRRSSPCLGEARLGIGMVARDVDGVTRHILAPAADGGWRLSHPVGAPLPRAVEEVRRWIHQLRARQALHLPVPLKRVLETRTRSLLEKLFRGADRDDRRDRKPTRTGSPCR